MTQGQANVVPSIQQAFLAEGVDVEIDGESVFVGSSLEYAGKLEFGDKGSNLEKRPWLNPALESNRTEINRRIAEAAIKGIRRGGR